jgi:predicted RNA-binding Zn-ribbon protein involved in translation (DUF1610 family)
MDQIEEILDDNTEENEVVKSLHFHCPNCGDLNQDDVVFLCNTCESKEMLFKDGVYICPSCLTKGQNFMCMKCDSKEVSLKSKI